VDAEPLSLDPGGTAFNRRDGGTVDLLARCRGLKATRTPSGRCLAASADVLVIGGVELRVPGRDFALLRVVLHAAHHANMAGGNLLEDLRRVLVSVGESESASALELADAHRGLLAFAAGLRLLPQGKDVARRLGIGEVSSLRHEIRREHNVVAEELHALLRADEGR
jgi:hypothetical protein